MSIFFGKDAIYKKSILNKLILSFLVIILCPILIISYFSYNRLVNLVQTTYKRDNIEILKTMHKNLQIYFEDFNRLTYNAFLSRDIQNMLTEDNTDPEIRLRNQLKFNNFTLNLIGDRSDVEGVYLICRNGYVYYKSLHGDIKLDYDLSEEHWFRELEKSEGKFIILGSHSQNYKVDPRFRYVISVARKIKNLDTGENLGILLIEIKPDIFYRLFKDIDSDERNIIIIDDKNNLVFDRVLYNYNATQYTVKQGKKNNRHVNNFGKDRKVPYMHLQKQFWLDIH